MASAGGPANVLTRFADVEVVLKERRHKDPRSTEKVDTAIVT